MFKWPSEFIEIEILIVSQRKMKKKRKEEFNFAVVVVVVGLGWWWLIFLRILPRFINLFSPLLSFHIFEFTHQGLELLTSWLPKREKENWNVSILEELCVNIYLFIYWGERRNLKLKQIKIKLPKFLYDLILYPIDKAISSKSQYIKNNISNVILKNLV